MSEARERERKREYFSEECELYISEEGVVASRVARID